MEFNARQQVTPVPRFAGAAIYDIRNAIYQRMRDITRLGRQQGLSERRQRLEPRSGPAWGDDERLRRREGLDPAAGHGTGGHFCRCPIGPVELRPSPTPATSLYLYRYYIEDILSWTCSKPEEPTDSGGPAAGTVTQFDQSYFLPTVQVSDSPPVDQPGHRQGQLAVLRHSGLAGRSIRKAGRGRRVGTDPHPVRDAGHRQQPD